MESHTSVKVSIIIPIYNVEEFVEACIRSALAQDYSNIELILVDDGSPDGSGKIVDKYAAIDNRIIPIHKENHGVSAARNDGLARASGEYIMFIDGDDYVEPDYVSYFLSLVQETNADMAVGYDFFTNESQKQNDDLVRNIDAETAIEDIYLQKLGVAVWNKIYRTDIIRENMLGFNTDFWYAEGMCFNIMYLQHADTIMSGRRKTYHAVENTNSATRHFRLSNNLCGLRSMEYQRDHWLIRTNRIMMAWEYHYRRYAEEIIKGLKTSGQADAYKKVYKKCVHELRHHIRIPIQVDITTWEKVHAIYMMVDPEYVLLKISSFSDCKTFSERIRLLKLKLFYRIPYSWYVFFVDRLCKCFRNHYRMVYLRRGLV